MVMQWSILVSCIHLGLLTISSSFKKYFKSKEPKVSIYLVMLFYTILHLHVPMVYIKIHIHVHHMF
jgi:hypothetical protein